MNSKAIINAKIITNSKIIEDLTGWLVGDKESTDQQFIAKKRWTKELMAVKKSNNKASLLSFQF